MKKQTYKLGDVCDINSGMSLKSDQIGCGNVPLCSVKSIKNGKIDETFLYSCDVDSSKIHEKCWISFEDILLVNCANVSCGKIGINLTEKSFFLGAFIFKLRSNNSSVLFQKYLYFYLTGNKLKIDSITTEGIFPRIRSTDLSGLTLTLPPLELQKKIVALLDPFAELELRQKQYRYYRDLLLREPLEDPLIKVQEYELGEVCEIILGTSFKSSDFIESGIPVIKQGSLQDGLIVAKKINYVNPKRFSKSEKIQYGEIAIIARGLPNIGKIGINLTNQEFLFDGGFMWKLRSNTNQLKNKYLYYFLLNNFHEIKNCFNEGMWPSINKNLFLKLKIWIPDLDTQEKIISKLDNLSEKGLIGELKTEIGKRKKQFEYYRDYLVNEW